MSRRANSPAARRAATAFTLEQTARAHRATVGNTAATLKARARAARTMGLESITVQLPVGEATLAAAALSEWVRAREAAAAAAAVNDRKDGTA